MVTPAGGRTPLPGQLEPDGPLVSVISDPVNVPAVNTRLFPAAVSTQSGRSLRGNPPSHEASGRQH